MTYETRMDLCDPHPNLLKLKFARLRLDLSGCLHLEGTRSRHRMSSAEWLAQHRSESDSPNTLAYFIMLRVGITYPRILLGLILTDFLLTFVVPSGIARVVIMASIALGLAEAFKSGPGSNVSRGMFLVLSYTANIFDKMIIAGLPDVDGREAVRILRKNGFKAPIIMLTGHNTDSDTILGLESGANDYVAKPFRFAVLLARIRAQLRQHEASEDAVFTIGPYTFRPRSKILLNSNGSKMRLTDKETGILRYLYRAGPTSGIA